MVLVAAITVEVETAVPASAAAHVRPDDVGGEILRRAMQPAGQHGMVRERPGILREHHKHTLRHVLGQV